MYSTIRPLRSIWGIIAILYLLFAVIARFFPLIGDLHYELSAVTALLASLLSGVAAIYSKRPPLPEEDAAANLPTGTRAASRDDGAVWQLVSTAVLISIIPLVVPLIGSLFGADCGLGEGTAWYLLLVPASAAISVVLASAAATIAHRRWRALLLFVTLWSASLFRGAYEAYTGPHIFMYGWHVGFFPGGSWDAELPITPLLVIYRIAHLLIAGVLAMVIVEIRRSRSRGPIAPNIPLLTIGSLIGVAAIAAIAIRPDLGLTRTDRWIRNELGDSLRMAHATIYYNAPTTDSVDLWRAANLTEFYISEHARALGIAPPAIEHISIYLYPSPSIQKKMVGTSSAAFTKPWSRKLNMTFNGVGSTLRHELAHVMLAPFGNPLGISLSQGLLEGSAMALENDHDWRTLHEHVRAMDAFGLAPRAEQVMSVGGFSSRRSSVSYVLSGSFSRWLIERYGMERYLRMFAWSDFDEAYGKSLHELSEEYHRFIDSLPAPDAGYEPTARYLFGGGSFFFQKCLRRIGTLNGAGFEAIAEERYDEALARFRESLGEGINYGARAGILQALGGLGRFRELLDSAHAYDADTASYPLLPYLIERGDAHWGLGDTASARRLYDSVLSLDIGPGILLRAALRRYFIAAPDTLRDIMRLYFTRPLKLTQRMLLLDRGLAHLPPSRERLVLSLVRSGLTSSSIPAMSLAELAGSADDLESMMLYRHTPVPVDTIARDALTRFIIYSLASRLRDAALLYKHIHPHAAGSDRVSEAIVSTLIERHGPYLPMRGPAPYLAERSGELDRFIRFLESGSMVMPWR